jgi:hypothetical protein
MNLVHAIPADHPAEGQLRERSEAGGRVSGGASAASAGSRAASRSAGTRSQGRPKAAAQRAERSEDP